MRICQQDQKCLYSIIHLNHFFIDVVLHLIQTINKSFEFLRSNNFESPLLMKRHDHFRNFFDLCRKLSIEENKIATTIVFAIFLNAYPVRAHDESFMTIKIFFVWLSNCSTSVFNPTETYSCLYEFTCMKSLKLSFCKVSLVKNYSHDILERLIGLFSNMMASKTTAQQVHRDQLMRFFIPWSDL